MLDPRKTRSYLAALFLMVCGTLGPASRGDEPESGPGPEAGGGGMAYRWFSLPIEVEGLPEAAEFVPISCAVDLTATLARFPSAGAVDERSLRLYHRTDGPGQAEEEVPVQFIASPQPRPKVRATLPDTPPNVSYAGEYRAGANPTGIKVEGTLAWAARGDADGRARYRLAVGVPTIGTLVQVP